MLNIPGFPDFAGAMKELGKVHTQDSRPDFEYQVTVPVGDNLIITQALVGKYETSSFAQEFGKVLQKHDAEFNKQHLKASSAAAGSSGSAGVAEPAAALKLENEYDDLDSFRAERKQLLGD